MDPARVSQVVDGGFVLSQLEQMVRIPSVTGDEGALGQYVAEGLAKVGLAAETTEVARGRFNVVAEWCGDEPGPGVMLAGHLDTVGPVAGWSRDPFVPTRQGDRLYGLGACDMKAGIAAIMGAVHVLAQWGGIQQGSLVVCLVVDEEAYSAGMKDFLARGGRPGSAGVGRVAGAVGAGGVEGQAGVSHTGGVADMAIMAEPHFAEAVIAAPGKILVGCRVKGRAAHAATPEAGVNAVFEACRFLTAIKELPGRAHPVLGSHRYCVLDIRGGHDKYCIVVPEECRFLLNKHTVPGEDAQTVVQQLEDLKRQLGLRAEVELEVPPPYYPAYIGDVDGSPAKDLAEAFFSVTGQQLRFGATTGVSDANLLWGAGIPTVSFGPSGGNLHAADEWVSVSETLVASRVYAWLVARLCGVKHAGRRV